MSKTNEAKTTATEGYKVTTADMEVKKDEQVPRTRTIDTEAKKVTLYNVSKNDKTGKNYKVNWTFDFSGVSDEQLLELASRSAVIAYRKHFRGVAEDSIPEYANQNIDVVSDILTHERKGLSAGDKAKKLFEKMNEEEKQAVLKELGLA